MLKLVIILALAQALDLLTTLYAVSMWGAHVEQNLFIRMLVDTMGIYGFIVPKIVAITILSVILMVSRYKLFAWVLIIVSLVPVVNNLIVLIQYA